MRRLVMESAPETVVRNVLLSQQRAPPPSPQRRLPPEAHCHDRRDLVDVDHLRCGAHRPRDWSWSSSTHHSILRTRHATCLL